MSLRQSSPALTSAQDIIASGRETIVSPCCPVCQNLDPTEHLTERIVIPRSPLGSRGRTQYSEAKLLSQWGAGRVALFNREFGELNDRRRTGCIYCALLLQACEILGMKGTEINIWLERGQNPKVTVWTRCNKRISFELFTNRGKAPPRIAFNQKLQVLITNKFQVAKNQHRYRGSLGSNSQAR
jgi:hypothetical protein